MFLYMSSKNKGRNVHRGSFTVSDELTSSYNSLPLLRLPNIVTEETAGGNVPF